MSIGIANNEWEWVVRAAMGEGMVGLEVRIEARVGSSV